MADVFHMPHDFRPLQGASMDKCWGPRFWAVAHCCDSLALELINSDCFCWTLITSVGKLPFLSVFECWLLTDHQPLWSCETSWTRHCKTRRTNEPQLILENFDYPLSELVVNQFTMSIMILNWALVSHVNWLFTIVTERYLWVLGHLTQLPPRKRTQGWLRQRDNLLVFVRRNGFLQQLSHVQPLVAIINHFNHC